MKEFQTAKMDSSTRIFSFIFGGITVGAILMLLIFKTAEQKPMWFIIPILLAALVCSYLMIPKLFVDNQKIKIKNTFVDIKIPFEKIQKIERFEKTKLNIRTLGVGGLFGYFGYFNGSDVWYVTNTKKKLKITMNSGKIYMISPENTEELISEVQKGIA